MKDLEIVQLYIARDENAIIESSKKYGKRLFHIANNIIADEETSKECENDTYFQAWNLIPPNHPADYLFSFLAKIIRHLSLDVYRKKTTGKRSACVLELTQELEQCLPSGECDAEQVILAQELGKCISNFLRTLPTEQRQIFMRRYWYMDSTKEIAKTFLCSESKVKTMLFRVRGKLKEYLKKEGYIL